MPLARSLAGARGARLLTVFAVVLALVHGIALALFIERNCYFFGDDFTGFWLSLERSWAALLVPVGGQVVPLTRALNQVFYVSAGANYHLALGILVGIHALSAWMLYRVLDQLRPSAVNAVIVALYCTYVSLWIQLGWWSSGIERVPYVLFGLLALHHYLKYADGGGRGHLLALVVCDLIALGFYIKALFFPLCFLAVEWAARERPSFSQWIRRREVSLCIGLFALSAVYVYAAHRLMADTLPRPKLDPSAQLRFVITGLSVFAHSLFGITLLPGAVAHPWVPLACAACAAFTIFRAPRTAVAWLLGLSILVLNIALVAVSNRVGIWGDIMAYEARYYYDVDFLVLVFLGIIAHELESDAHAPRRPPLDYGRPIPAAVLAVALFAHAVFSARNVFTGAFAVSRALPETRAFVANLKADLSSVRARGVDAKFVDGNLPVFVSGLDLNFRKHSQLFRVLGLPGEFVPEPLAVLRVADDGHLVETKAR